MCYENAARSIGIFHCIHCLVMISQSNTKRHNVSSLHQLGRSLSGCALTVGNFDGVHLGHQTILSRLTEFASKNSCQAVAITFEPHPVRFFKPDIPPFRLTTPDQKVFLLVHYGVNTPIIVTFDTILSKLEPEAFVRQILHDVFHPQLVVVGYDFNYGKGRRGTPEILSAVASDLGMRVEVQEPVYFEQEVVSSTRIRKALRAGDVDLACQLLGRPHFLWGDVVKGAGRGRGLGFPTANLMPSTKLLPAHGVYATFLEIGEKVYRSITNIGVRPTFGESETTIESYVLDAESEDLALYDLHAAVHLVKRIRGEQVFPSAAALIEQIDRDIAACRKILDDTSPSGLVPVSDR